MSRPSPTLIAIAAACIAVALALLPVWDGLTHRGVLGMVAVLVGLALGVVAAVLFVRRPLRWQWGVIGVGGAIFILYAQITGAMLILERSRLVSRLPDCADAAATYQLDGAYAGPRSSSGVPCVQPSEGRDAFRRRHPTGELFDGFRQIMLRFPADLARVLFAPMASLFLLITAGILLAKATGPLIQAQRDAESPQR